MSNVKIVIHPNYGCFYLSNKGKARFEELAGIPFDVIKTSRSDRHLVQVVEEGLEGGKLEIAELPEGTAYQIDEYDGSETIVLKSEMRWRIAREVG